MKTLIALLEQRNPGSSNHPFFRGYAWKWVRQYEEIQKLRYRRPEVYEASLMGLVEYISAHCTDEGQEYFRAHQSRNKAALDE